MAGKYDDIDTMISNISKDIKPLETYYSFNVMQKDLMPFADVALREVGADMTLDYPLSIVAYINNRILGLLQGKSKTNKDQQSTDVATAKHIQSILNGVETVEEAIKIINKDIKSFAKAKADLIGTTEVSSITEESRKLVYLDLGYKNKESLSVNDPFVSNICRECEKQGSIKIDSLFASGKASPPHHIRCRCTVAYYE